MLGIDAAKAIGFHRYMLSDTGRTESYQKAIIQTVKPGDVVVDIGTGTGILAFFACQAGARRVYAIEDGPAIELARQICAKNGFQDRIVFLKEQSYHAVLPERVDVIICEILGSIALQGGILGLLIDAQKRMLKAGGRIVPQSLAICVAPVETPQMADEFDVWKEDLYGLDFSSIRALALNNFHNFKCEAKNFLSDPKTVGTVLFTEAQSAYFRGTATFDITRPGVMHGIAGWLNLELIEGITISNSPYGPNVNWGHAFFPLEPVPVNIGDTLSVALSTHDGVEWRWEARVHRLFAGKNGSQVEELRFDHCTFFGFPLNHHRLTDRTKPKLSRKGEAVQFLLGLLNGNRTMEELEGEFSACYLDLFPTAAAKAAFIKEIVRKNI